jgi:hypothetical protein
VVEEGVRGVSWNTIAVGVFSIVGTLLGVALGLFGERWVRRWGAVRCVVDSWEAIEPTNGIEERDIQVTFLNDKDVNAVIWDMRVEFHREGHESLFPPLTYSEGVDRGQLVGKLNLPPQIAVTRRMRMSLHGEDLRMAWSADRAEFVATIAGIGEGREELRPPWR